MRRAGSVLLVFVAERLAYPAAAMPRGGRGVERNLTNVARGRVVWWGGFGGQSSSVAGVDRDAIFCEWYDGDGRLGPITVAVAGTDHSDSIIVSSEDVPPSARGRDGQLACTTARRRSHSYGNEHRAVPSSLRTELRQQRLGLTIIKPPQVNVCKLCKKPRVDDSANEANDVDSNDNHNAPSLAVLKSVTQPLIPQYVWHSLTGREFFYPQCISSLARTGIRIATDSNDIIDWKPDKHTHKMLNEEAAISGKDVLRTALKNGEIMVWTGKFKSEGHGSELPVVKTTWILDMSPREFAELLMDSSRVKTYNKMSLGRTDVVKFQDGIDTASEKYGDGESKIVRNLTKPPLSKRNMEFITLMHARRIKETDDADVGAMGGDGKDAYIVVSRAVGGNSWANGSTMSSVRGGASSSDDDFIRSEILLGVNVIRSVPGYPRKAEVTAVTHCNSPSVPKMLAGKVGVKGAVDFVKDVRSLCI